MKGFIEVTPKYYNHGDLLMGIDDSYSLGHPESVNVNKIVCFGDGWINFNPLFDTDPIKVKQTYQELKELIIEATKNENSI